MHKYSSRKHTTAHATWCTILLLLLWFGLSLNDWYHNVLYCGLCINEHCCNVWNGPWMISAAKLLHNVSFFFFLGRFCAWFCMTLSAFVFFCFLVPASMLNDNVLTFYRAACCWRGNVSKKKKKNHTYFQFNTCLHKSFTTLSWS